MGFSRSPATKAARLRLVLASICVCLSVTPLASQLITSDVSQYAHTTWIARDSTIRGVPRAITQTTDGYLWIGTPFGLYRFDGINFKLGQPRGGQALAHLSIRSLLGASDGSLWIGTDGKGLFHLKDGHITSVSEFANATTVMKIVQDRAGDVWAGGMMQGPGNRLCRIHEGSVDCFGDAKMIGAMIHDLFVDKQGSLWVASDAGFWRWMPGQPTLGTSFNREDLFIDANDLPVQKVRGKHRLSHGPERGKLLPTGEEISELPASMLLTDREGGLWIGTTDRGLIHSLHGRADTYRSIDGLSSDLVYDLFEDSEGDIWVATSSGLDRFRKRAIPVVSSKQGLSADRVVSVTADGQNVWIATTNGLNLVNDTTIKKFSVADGLPTDGLTSIYLAAPGHLLIAGGMSDGLVWMQNGHVKKLTASSGPNSLIMAPDGEGGVWLCNRESGLMHLLPSGKGVDAFPWAVFGGKRAPAIAYDPKRKGVWLAFVGGDLEFFQDGQVKARYLDPLDNPRDIQVEADGTVWVGSNAGLIRLKDGHATTLNSRNGLPCDGVHWRRDDHQHSSWLNTPCGLIQLAPGELDRWSRDPGAQVKITKHLDASDGAEESLIGGWFSPRATIAPDGRLAFVSDNGLSVIDPSADIVNHVPPPVHIQGIEADAKQYSLEEAVNLPPKTHVVRLAYTALNFSAPQKVKNRYKLEGYDAHWSEELSTREAVYTNLPPGGYRFRVIASNDSGIWNDTGDTLSFAVRAAFYQTRWFLAICLVVLFALTWILYRSRVNYLCQQITTRVEAQTSERLHVSRDLHDTLLQGIQGLILSFHAISAEPTLAQPVRQRIIDLSGRAEEVMEEGRDKIRALRFENQPQGGFVGEVARLASRIHLGEPPTFNISATGTEVPLNPLIHEEMCFICREALSNAFQHANAQTVEVAISFGRSRFEVVIRDDGRGFKFDASHLRSATGHWGVVGMRERAAHIGAAFEINKTSLDKTNPGTSIITEIPATIAYAKDRHAS